MTIKELFADYGEEYADVFIMDSEDDGNAYRGAVFPFHGEIAIEFTDKTPKPAKSYADREISLWFVSDGIFHITLGELKLD